MRWDLGNGAGEASENAAPGVVGKFSGPGGYLRTSQKIIGFTERWKYIESYFAIHIHLQARAISSQTSFWSLRNEKEQYQIRIL